MSTDWQPIETAPKDGTEILAITKFNHERRIFIVQWGKVERDEDVPVGDGLFRKVKKHWMEGWFPHGGAVWFGTIQATHWLPLPKLPAS